MVHRSFEISYVMKRVVNLMIYHFQFATNDPLMFAGMLTTLSDGLLIVPRTVQMFPMMGWIVLIYIFHWGMPHRLFSTPTLTVQ